MSICNLDGRATGDLYGSSVHFAVSDSIFATIRSITPCSKSYRPGSDTYLISPFKVVNGSKLVSIETTNRLRSLSKLNGCRLTIPARQMFSPRDRRLLCHPPPAIAHPSNIATYCGKGPTAAQVRLQREPVLSLRTAPPTLIRRRKLLVYCFHMRVVQVSEYPAPMLVEVGSWEIPSPFSEEGVEGGWVKGPALIEGRDGVIFGGSKVNLRQETPYPASVLPSRFFQ
jgi:hypothetical protein